MKQFAMLMFAVVSLALTGCGKKVDFRNTEVSNNMIYEDGKNDPFTGLVTNVPLSVVPVLAMDTLLATITVVTGDRWNAHGSTVCDVEFDEGRPNGSSECHSSKSSAPLLKYKYDDGVPVGDLTIYSDKEEGKILAKAELNDEGQLDGDITVFNASSGDRILDGHYDVGARDGKFERYDTQTGELAEVSNWVKGSKEGESFEYAADGKSILKKMNYKDGKLDGPFEQYDEHGKLVKQTTFVAGLDQQQEAQYRQEAEALIAAGLPYGVESTVDHLRHAYECLASRMNDPKETDSEAELYEYCEVWTVEKVRQNYGNDVAAESSPEEDQLDLPAAALEDGDGIAVDSDAAYDEAAKQNDAAIADAIKAAEAEAENN